MKSEKSNNDLRIGKLLNLATSLAIVNLALAGCSRPSASETVESEAALDAEVTAEERPYFDAARPFVEAIASRDYARAYEQLSSHAKARMSPNQFVAPDDDATQQRNEAKAVNNPSPEQFAQLMTAVEQKYGSPSKLAELNVFSTNPTVLSGQAKSTEDRLEAMFAIGLMPASIPAGIRKASLRSKLVVELSPQELAETAKAYQMTPEQLKANPDFQPYVTLKTVLVEDSGALRIGYFEFLPPGMFD